MKKQLLKLFSLICVIVSCVGIAVPAYATTSRASDYLSYYTAYVVTGSNDSGDVIIEFEVDATGRMSLVGSSCAVIQEKVGTKWVGVATYFGSALNGMLSENAFAHSSNITYEGTSGKQYRALVTVYAEDSTGYDSRVITTNEVTAP